MPHKRMYWDEHLQIFWCLRIHISPFLNPQWTNRDLLSDFIYSLSTQDKHSFRKLRFTFLVLKIGGKKNGGEGPLSCSLIYSFIRLFIRLFVCSLICSFLCLFFYLDQHHRHNQIPFLITYIERRQAEIDLIGPLSAKFQMNWPMEQMLRLTRWSFTISAPKKGGSVEEITLYQNLNCCTLKESNQRSIRLLHSLQSFQSMVLWINCSIRLEKVKCIIQPLHVLWRGFH